MPRKAGSPFSAEPNLRIISCTAMESPPEENVPELERLAHTLVAEALDGYERVLAPDALQDIREYLIDELLCSSYGLARLRRLSALPSASASDEIVREHEVLKNTKKDGSVP